MELSQQVVNIVDWTVVGISGALVISSTFGVIYTVLYSTSSLARPARDFNYLWRARVLSQVLAALYAASLVLRLQVLWGPQSALAPGGLNQALLCRIYTAVTYGLLEPLYLLLALFSCMFSVQGKAMSAAHPSSGITFFALGFTLPCCAAQLICALFTRLFALNYNGSWVLWTLFSTYDTHQTDHCPAEQREVSRVAFPSSLPPTIQSVPDIYDPTNCAFCIFALFSSLVSASFALCFLLVAWNVTQRIATAAINKTLVQRVRWLQLLVLLFLPASIICRGLTILFHPFQLGFELLRLGNVVCIAGMVLSISSVLVLKPVHDAYVADKYLRTLSQPGVWPSTASAMWTSQP